MSKLHKLLFDVVHKMLIPRKKKRIEANLFYLTLVELLDTGISIDLPQLILQHMVRVSQQDKKGHVLPYGFWMGVALEYLQVPDEFGIFK